MKYSRIALIASWILITVSMTSWWLIYGLKQIERSGKLGYEVPTEVIKGERMLHWEGGFLIGLLIVGGLALLGYSISEFYRNQQVKEFFATLTHELKTPLASLRLQVESLQEDLAETKHAKLVDRLVGDAGRLELQLENALFLASAREMDQLHIENLTLENVLSSLNLGLLEMDIPKGALVKADPRALEGILKNIIQNAKTHGQATKIKVKAKLEGANVRITLEDNGKGFSGDYKKLALLFSRPSPTSGSGVGLYLSKTLAKKMNGSLEFDRTIGSGFVVHVILKGRMV
jgi:signal transduction histidine kinase